MEEKSNNNLYCSHCGALIDTDDYEELNGEIVCRDCIDRYCTSGDHCGSLIWQSDAYGDEYTNLCSHCYHSHYTRCCSCDALVYEDDVYHLEGDSYCRECYDEERDKSRYIHDYSYKPEPIFLGGSDRYFGVELEIDCAGKDDDYAEELLNIGNINGDHIYIKGDASLDDGMEIVSYPMSLNYHKSFCWDKIMRKSINLGYRSHNMSTCGLHVHVNRNCMGDTREEQDEVISLILLYVYASTESIMKNVLKRVGMQNFGYKVIETLDGHIIKIDKDGNITRSEFECFRSSKCMSWYDGYDDYYTTAHEQLLLEMCGCLGVDEEDVMMLLDYGYTPDEVEDMLMDYDLINETVKAIKFEEGKSLYDYAGGCI